MESSIYQHNGGSDFSRTENLCSFKEEFEDQTLALKRIQRWNAEFERAVLVAKL
jgi:hypothetical protein